jgi:hypothetical protein
MIRRFLTVLIVSCLCFGPVAGAADLPLTKVGAVPPLAKASVKPKRKAAKPTQVVAARKANVSTADKTEQAVIAPKSEEIQLSWALDRLVAQADGSKREGSASARANLVVTEPGFASSSAVTIQLSGHVVKTARTTARIDVQVGGKTYSVRWTSDDVEAGRFSRTFKATLSEGKLPSYVPVSAIAFVTRERDGGAVLVTLEKMTIVFDSIVLADAQ